MNLEELVNLILNNPENIHIEYSNVNGEESLLINGKEVTEKELFDDSDIKNEVKNYKDVVNKLDDCLFIEILEDSKQYVDLKTFDELLEQDSYTKEEADVVKQMINLFYTLIQEHISNKIIDLEEILEQI